MEKHVYSMVQRVLALLLCFAMLVPSALTPVFATEAAETTEPAVTDNPEAAPEASVPAGPENENSSLDSTVLVTGTGEEDAGIELLAAEPTFTILAGSDFQANMPRGSDASEADDKAAEHMAAILDRVIENHSIDAFLFGGDYSSVTPGDNFADPQYCINGYNRLMAVLADKGVTTTVAEEDMFFVQGNHDHVEPITGLPFIDETAGYDREHYGVYVLNYKNYNSGKQEIKTVTDTATLLDRWLEAQTVGEKPIFIISHVPLHYSIRAYEKGDAQYAEKIVDVLNKYGARGLNIIFLYGHNHEEKNSQYMGGSTNFVARGESIYVPNTAGTTQTPTKVNINFTYMNAGFAGWYGPWSESPVVTDDLTMSVFEVRGDDVTITRYSKDGVFPLQEKVGTFYDVNGYNESAMAADMGYTVDSTAQASPLTVRGGEYISTPTEAISISISWQTHWSTAKIMSS